MSKPLDRDTALFQRFKALLAEEEKGDDSAADASGAGMTPEVFYVRLRERLFANAASQGVEFLDEVASSILADERDGRAALTGTVVLLPDPRKQRARTAAQLVAFKTEMALVSSKKRSATGPAGGRTSKRAKTPSPMKMVKSSGSAKAAKTALASPPPFRRRTLLPIPRMPPPSLVLAKNAPAQLKRDWESVLAKATKAKRSPARLAYPWEGRRLWYDPTEFVDLHLEHWRFWMAFRDTFWGWTLHIPLDTVAANTHRRKLKMQAIRARLQFLGLCVETWGWYGFLERWDNTLHDKVLWLGGRSGKRSGKGQEGALIDNLAAVYEADREQYDTVIKNALKPVKIDAGGYSDIQTLLEETGALNPDTPSAQNRLSDRALVRIRIDLRTHTPDKPHWAGNPDETPWKELLACSRLDAMQGHITSALNDDVYAVEAPESFRSYEGADSDVSDFEDEDGHPTALAAEARTLDSEDDDEGDDDEGPGTIPRYLSVQESSDDDTENGPDKEEEEAEGDGDDESTASPAAASKESPPNPSSAPSTSAPKKKSSPTPTSGKPTPPKDAASKGKNAFSSK